jgi:WD40 repeat protein/mono/diheme cytochrome c family protein
MPQAAVALETPMNRIPALRRLLPALVPILFFIATTVRADDSAALAKKAKAVLDANCHRCHGQDGNIEGGFNYVLDRDKLVARNKIVPGHADQSPLYKKASTGKMPPAGEKPRPSDADIAVLKEWIDAGAPADKPRVDRPLLTEAGVFELMLSDLEKQDKRSRRFLRYFSLAPLANGGMGPDEAQSYRNALAKLINSLSWHPRITLPKPIDADGLVLRIDLRDYQWDSTLWNRLVSEYPYGLLVDTAVSRAVIVQTASRQPCVRLDWFVASASRAPLYYDLLQLPTNLSELERQLRVDVAVDIQQERVARAGFLGSGISRNNRMLERHDAMNGAYWRTYDFDAIPQNLNDRDNLLPDRRNLFAYPLGPGTTDNTFQHAAGEAIFNLPNGLQGYILVNANNVRIEKGLTAIVSDPKRPDRAVEAGVSCINCHARGILTKDDQIRDHVAKNPKAFSKADADLVKALYPPAAKTRALMEEDAERFRKALEKTGNKVGSVEVVMALTLRYEADVDLATLAAEAGVKPETLLDRIAHSEALAKHFGALKVPGAEVPRQVVVQGFGDVVRELRLGSPIQPGSLGQTLADNTGEVDPLEAQSSPANAIAFSRDGRFAAIAAADKSVRIVDVEANRDLRRCIGHTASVWCVAFSPDSSKLLSGGKDGSVRLWDVATARELQRLDGHEDLVTAVAFAPDGRRALSAGFDDKIILWDLDKGKAIPEFKFDGAAKYVNAVAFAPDGERALICAENKVFLLDAKTGKVLHTLTGHTGSVVCAVFSADGKQVLSGSDDRTLRLWDAKTGHEIHAYLGHENGVKSVAISPDGKQLLSGGSDATVRLWDADAVKELKVFRKHSEPLVAVAFIADGAETLSGSRDAVIKPWLLKKAPPTPPTNDTLPAVNELIRPNVVKADLSPSATIPLGGTVGNVFLSPNRKWLYYLNLTDSKVGRVNLETGKRDKDLRLADGTDALAMTPDGKTLVATARDGKSSKVQVIDSAKWELRSTFSIKAVAYDVVAADDGVAYVSGGDGDWTEICVVDIKNELSLTRYGRVWTRSFLGLSPDQQRLYYSSQGVTPGTLDALVLPKRPGESEGVETYSAPAPGRQPLGGEFQLTPDGHFLLCKSGTVLRLSATKQDDLKFHTALEPFVTAAIDPEARTALLLTRDGTLEQYSYPAFELKASHRLDIVPYQMVFDGKQGKLYVAGFDPRGVADRPRARGFGDLFVYDLKELTAKKK